jgi:hypothetical protein
MANVIKTTLFAVLLLAIETSFAMEKDVPKGKKHILPTAGELTELLDRAIHDSDVEKVESAIGQGARLDVLNNEKYDKYYNNPLANLLATNVTHDRLLTKQDDPVRWANAKKREKIIELLIEAGAPLKYSLDFKKIQGASTYLETIEKSEKKIMELLKPRIMSIVMMQGPLTDDIKQKLKNYLKVYDTVFSIKDDNNDNLLHLAIYNGHFDAAMILIEAMRHKVNLLNKKNGDELTPLELGYGRWGDENEKWNSFIAHLPKRYSTDAEEARKSWEKFRAESFAAGKAGLDLSQRGKGELEKSTQK